MNTTTQSDHIDSTQPAGQSSQAHQKENNKIQQIQNPEQNQTSTYASSVMISAIFTSSLAGLALAGYQISKSTHPGDGIISFIGIWASLTAMLLVAAYFAGAQKPIAQFVSRSNWRTFLTTLVCSSVMISGTALALNLQSATPSTSSTSTSAASSPDDRRSSMPHGTTPLGSFQSLQVAAPKFSEHYWTPPNALGEDPFTRKAPNERKYSQPPVDGPLMIEVQNKKLAETITPAAAKPDRTIKSEKPSSLLKKKKAVTKPKSKKVRRKVAKPATKEKSTKVAAKKTEAEITPLVKSVKPGQFSNNQQIDCSGSQAIGSSACREQLGR